MKRLKQWVRGWLDWLAVKLGYTRADDAKAAWESSEAWRSAYTDAQRRYSFAQDRLNKLMRYKKVQEQAARIDEIRADLARRQVFPEGVAPRVPEGELMEDAGSVVGLIR